MEPSIIDRGKFAGHATFPSTTITADSLTSHSAGVKTVVDSEGCITRADRIGDTQSREGFSRVTVPSFVDSLPGRLHLPDEVIQPFAHVGKRRVVLFLEELLEAAQQ